MVSTNSHQNNIETDGFSSVEWLTDQAVKSHKAGKIEEAIACYLELIELDETQPCWIYGNTIILLAQNGFVNRAKTIGEKATKRYPKSDDLYRAMGIAYRHENNLVASANSYEEAIRLNEKQPGWVYSHLVDCFLDSGRSSQVVEIGLKGVEINPNFSWLNYQLGDIFSAQENWGKAFDFYNRAKKLESGLTGIDAKLKYTYNQKEQYQRGVIFSSYLISIKKEPHKPEHYKNALEIQPDNIELNLKLASVLIEQNCEDEALAYYNKAFEINPDLIQVYCSKAKKLNHESKQIKSNTNRNIW